MTDPGAEDLRTVERLAADGDIGKLAKKLVRAATLSGLRNPSVAEQVAAVAKRPEDERLRLVTAWADRCRRGTDTEEVQDLLLMLADLVGRGLGGELLADMRIARLEALGRRHSYWYAERLDVLAEAELASGRALSPAVVAVFRRTAVGTYRDPAVVALAKKLTEPVLNAGEEWADRAIAGLPEPAEAWQRLLRFSTTATAARPSAQWETAGRALIEEIGADAVRETVLPWIALVGRPRTLPLERAEYEPDVNAAYDPYNANALRGLAWLLSILPPHQDTARGLGVLVETSLRKVAGLGPRNPKVANAAVLALSRIEGEAALAELARLASRVVFKGTLKQIDAALETRAAAMGLSREEIEELAVPGYGLTGVGRRAHAHGELTVLGSKAVLSWRNAAGKAVKAVPAAVKRDHAEELKELKAAAKDIDKMLSALGERLDRQFLARRTWTYTAWRERYLDHPLVGTLARRLLWTVDGQACGYADGELRTLTDDPVPAGAEVELWHPVGREPAAIVAWRDWLERHAITQPFKQAHREVYLLTDAERNTRTYSNRFAAHILRQHQFHALAAARGWQNKLRLMVDDSYPPATRELPQWGLRAEFWVEGVGDDYGEDTTESGSYLRIGTDQVRFYPIGAPENWAHAGGGGYEQGWRGAPAEGLPIAEIPALVLSEVLRDADLFVGVASVGNDPTWQDGGPRGHFRDYWHSYGFGELSQSAETRRDLLTRLIPRLAIASRCTIDGRFLHVKGELHTYKIHLGSGNILMTPNDAYLCIVPKGGGTDPAADGGYLPFEGDRTLALILSKAMMLADDTGITDRTIISQL
ncbi:DUF4132 domain-containing protein [Streptomyces sp. H10-C2]|uniref:DUF4132 domain-containing protein n=1 Tax=unclassified Streptomyces TaxID=2593676 RepID=UPI0024B8E26C|nr:MULTISPECIES: DUF4132 domain-containing protein [unclassified Streptomyces]MDJ0340522.1 DUF4132 domain-containing protein [Streptomyces sp. PH10-H1]MDJ0370170.1 DUF4132 domain-containing protein [Streptomyces sp. H10-C2]